MPTTLAAHTLRPYIALCTEGPCRWERPCATRAGALILADYHGHDAIVLLADDLAALKAGPR